MVSFAYSQFHRQSSIFVSMTETFTVLLVCISDAGRWQMDGNLVDSTGKFFDGMRSIRDHVNGRSEALLAEILPVRV